MPLQWVPGTSRVLSPVVKEQEELLLGTTFVAILGKKSGFVAVPAVTKELVHSSSSSAWESHLTQ